MINIFRPAFRFIRRFWLLILGLLILAFIVGAFFLGRYTIYQQHPELSGAEQANDTLMKVGKLIQLPQNETPQMATINDAAAAKKAQPFLVNAANGDILIVYQTAAQAILYRPSSNKLIAVGPVTAQEPQTPAASNPTNATTTVKN